MALKACNCYELKVANKLFLEMIIPNNTLFFTILDILLKLAFQIRRGNQKLAIKSAQTAKL